MLAYKNIKKLHLELTTACNAKCPCCPRNVAGFDWNEGYPECDMTLDNIKKILEPEFLKSIFNIYISGDFGDFVMNPQGLEILEYLRQHCRRKTPIIIGTNGGARDKKFWETVARLASQVVFCIDGLEDTHSLYRRNTVYSTVIRNATTFIKAGGSATWKFIEFDHNRHQLEQARQLSKELGFHTFLVARHGRTSTPVFDSRGRFEYYIGPDLGFQSRVDGVLNYRTRKIMPSTAMIKQEPAQTLRCFSQENEEIYIAANGEVYPCCFMGHYPHTYQKNMSTTLGLWNMQIREIARENNAIEYGLEHAVNWFSQIESRWQASTWDQGRLLVCDQSCGECSQLHNNEVLSNTVQ